MIEPRHRQLVRRLFGVGAMLAGPVVAGQIVLFACSEPPSTSYGNPNTLDRKALPGEGGVEAVLCSGDGGASFEGGCPSFATQIFPQMKSDGGWRCADKACHGGASAPSIDESSAAACLESLKKITVGGKPYIAAGDGGDPTFTCNLQGTCGSKMPKPPGVDPTTAEICKVQAWLQCGAPP